MRTIERWSAWLLPAFLQISSGRYPEGGLCKKSLWISETHKQAHIQSQLHTPTHTHTHTQVFPILVLEPINTLLAALSVNKLLSTCCTFSILIFGKE